MSIWLTSDGAVKFPGLDLSLEHLISGYEVFGITISLSGILIAVALFLGLFIAECLAKKTGQNTEMYLDLAVQVVIGGVIGARITYVIMHWGYYKEQPAQIFALNQDGMSFLGALTAGLLISFAFCRKRKISWLRTCDTALLGVVAGQIIGKVGDFFGRTNLGTYSNNALAMQVEIADVNVATWMLAKENSEIIVGEYLQVHPVFLYEIIGLVGLYALLALIYKNQKMSGIVLAIYLVEYGVMRFYIEFLRLNSVRVVGDFLSLEHLMSLSTALFGIYVLYDCMKRQRTELKNLPKHFFDAEEQ